MAQSEFRIGPNGQKQRLNQNRRWENVEDSTSKITQNSPRGSREAASSDFGSQEVASPHLTGEERSQKQLEASSGFVNYLLDEGISPHHVVHGNNPFSIDEHIADYIEINGKSEDEYDHIIAELKDNDNNFTRAYKSLIDEASQYDRNLRERLKEDAYKEANHGVAVWANDPDLKATWMDMMFSGDFDGTYDEYYDMEVYDFYDYRGYQTEEVEMLVSEWISRVDEKSGENTRYFEVSSDNSGWMNRNLSAVIDYDDLRDNLARPEFIPAGDEGSYHWIQNKDGETLTIVAYHHDSPTGETWKVRPLHGDEAKRAEEDM